MTSPWDEWVHLFVRWLHVVAAVFWIGQTAFFTWLDRRFHVEARPGERDEVWMVHSGGFYVVEKKVGPELLPRPLHWFKWEASLTWLSGMMLLVLVYYLGGALVVPGSGTSVGEGTALGLATLALGWVLYDLLWLSPLGRNELLGGALCLALVAALAFGLTRVLSGRAAYLHVGSLLGTVMAANVWMRILPGQRRLIAAVRAGGEPDLTLAARAKQRSKHNTFMALPVVFIMISSHFPTTSYGHRWNWILLVGFLLVGFAARRALNWWEGRPEEPTAGGGAGDGRAGGGGPRALEHFNRLSATAATEALLGCCGCRRWAKDVAEARPFQDREDLLRAADGAFDRMGPEDWREAFAAHPRIGEGKAAVAPSKEAAGWSAGEQAGLRGADSATAVRLAAGNRAYEARFGHVFLICATGKSGAEMLSALEERLGNDPEKELDLAALEQRKITYLRLDKLLDRLAREAR